MIKEVIEYVKHSFNQTKQQHNSVNDVILKSALVYQHLYLRNFNTNISIDDVLELNNNEIGLIRSWKWMSHMAIIKNIWSFRYATLP